MCVNDALHAANTAQIEANNADISTMNDGTNEANEIKGQFEAFKGQIDCAVSNFESNTLGGAPVCSPNCSQMSQYAGDTIAEADKMIAAFKTEIARLEAENAKLQAEMDANPAPCGACAECKPPEYTNSKN